MTNVEIIKRKLSEIKKFFTIVKKYQNYSKEEILSDDTLKGAVERYLYLLCQATIDLAEAILVHFGLRTPFTYGEIFEILQENNIIDKNIALKMKKMTGFRNILTHAYGEININIVLGVLKKDINDFLIFTKAVEQKIKL